MTTELSKTCEQLQSLLGVVKRREQDATSRRVPRTPQSSSDRSSQVESSDPRTGNLSGRARRRTRASGPRSATLYPSDEVLIEVACKRKTAVGAHQRTGYPQGAGGSFSRRRQTEGA